MLPRIGVTGSVMAAAIGTRRTFQNEPCSLDFPGAAATPSVLVFTAFIIVGGAGGAVGLDRILAFIGCFDQTSGWRSTRC